MSRPLLALATGFTLLAGPIVLAPQPAQAQIEADWSFARVRAVNLARDTAVRLNGGLSLYRPASCMFDTSQGGGSCLIRRDDQGFLFRFPGGAPGWQQLGLQPNWDTEIQVSPDGRQVVQVVFNQPAGSR